eukprot:s18_g8.t1
MAALANNNVTCNASKQSSDGGYRRLSKRQKEVEKLLRDWEGMAKSKGRPRPSILGKMQWKREAERVVAARKAGPARSYLEKYRRLKKNCMVPE